MHSQVSQDPSNVWVCVSVSVHRNSLQKKLFVQYSKYLPQSTAVIAHHQPDWITFSSYQFFILAYIRLRCQIFQPCMHGS